MSSFWLSRNTNKKRFQIIYLTSYFVMTSRYFTINPRITRYSNFKRKQKSWSVAEAHYTNVVETHRAPGFGAMVVKGLKFEKCRAAFVFFFSFLVLSKETREKLVNGHHERSLKIDWCLSKARQNVIFFFFFFYFSPFSSVGDFLTREKECYGVYRVTDIVCRRVSAYKFL